MSPLFSDILVQQIGGHVDLDIVAKIDTRDRLEERLRAIGPDLVLIGLYHGEADEIAHSLLAAAPVAKVIAFSTDGRHAYVHKRGTHCTALIAQSALPDSHRTPGALNPMVTQETIGSICVRGWTRTVRPPQEYTSALKGQQVREFDYADPKIGDYEEDGGMTRKPRCPGLPAAYAQTPSHTPPAGMTCLGDKLVWVNTRSGVHHFQGERYFGSMKQGKFICERGGCRLAFRETGQEPEKFGKFGAAGSLSDIGTGSKVVLWTRSRSASFVMPTQPAQGDGGPSLDCSDY
jgi:hypothetical protein